MSERVVFGVRPVEELVRARPRDVAVVYVAEGHRGDEIHRAIAAARERAVTVEIRPRSMVADLAGSGSHQGIVAIAGAYRYSSPEEMCVAAAAASEAPLLVLLDGVTDPQNLGAVVRCVEVMGAHGVIIPDRKAAPVTGAVVKSSAGASERVRIARVSNLLRTIDDLRQRGLRVIGTAAAEGDVPANTDLRGPVALVMGSEGEGLREAVARRCDGALRIPQRGNVASLNVSAACAILLYEAARQRV